MTKADTFRKILTQLAVETGHPVHVGDKGTISVGAMGCPGIGRDDVAFPDGSIKTMTNNGLGGLKFDVGNGVKKEILFTYIFADVKDDTGETWRVQYFLDGKKEIFFAKVYSDERVEYWK